MNSTEQENCLAEILQLTDAMLADAGREDWDALSAKQNHRDTLIGAFFQESLVLDAQTVSDRIRYVLMVDEQIQALGRQYQQGLRRELQSISRGKNAVRAYAEIRI